MQVVYGDTLFLLNFAADYLVLLVTARIGAARLRRGRFALAAALGGVYAVLVALWPRLGDWPLRLLVGGLLVLVSFSGERGKGRLLCIFLLTAFAFGGTVLALSPTGAVSLPVLAAAFGLGLLGLTAGFRRLGRRRAGGLVQVEVTLRGRRVQFAALVDTGNVVQDPVTGHGVLLAERDALLPLFDRATAKALEQSTDPAALAARLASSPVRFRLVPYRAVGVEGGLLLCFRPDGLRLNGRARKDLLVALSPTRLSEGGVYAAIAGGEIG